MKVLLLYEYLEVNGWFKVSTNLFKNEYLQAIIKIEGGELKYIVKNLEHPNIPTKNFPSNDYHYLFYSPLIVMIHYLNLVKNVESYEDCMRLIKEIEKSGDTVYYDGHRGFNGLKIFRAYDEQEIEVASFGICCYIRPTEMGGVYQLGFSEFPLKILLVELCCFLNPSYEWDEKEETFNYNDLLGLMEE